MELVLDCLTNEINDKKAAAEAVMYYLSKSYTAEYCQIYTDSAQKLQQREERKNLQPPPDPEFPEDMILYDPPEDNIRNVANSLWNLRYGELLAYKELHGHCRVPVRPTELGKWVRQTRIYASKLSPKRKELLDAVGFCWKATNFVQEDVRMPKAVAAKLTFVDVTAQEALELSGFGPDEAKNDNRKKLVNSTVCRFDTLKCKPSVLPFLERLPQDVLEIFEDSPIRTRLLSEGKLTTKDTNFNTASIEEGHYEEQPAHKKQRTHGMENDEPYAVLPNGTSGNHPPLPMAMDPQWF